LVHKKIDKSDKTFVNKIVDNVMEKYRKYKMRQADKRRAKMEKKLSSMLLEG
jgi:type III secretory pathway component EscR